MDLRDYARVILRRGWLIALAALLTSLFAIAFAELQRPTYRSEAVLQVVPGRLGDYGNTLAASQMLRVLSFQATTTRMANEVSGELELDVPPERLLGYVHTSSEADGLRIRIQVDWSHPLIAQQVAQGFAENFVDAQDARSAQLDSRDRLDVNILEPAKEGWVHWPRTKPLALAGLFLGLLVGGAIVLALEHADSAYLRSTEDVERHVKTSVLGTIPPLAATSPAAPLAAGRRWWQVWRGA